MKNFVLWWFGFSLRYWAYRPFIIIFCLRFSGKNLRVFKTLLKEFLIFSKKTKVWIKCVRPSVRSSVCLSACLSIHLLALLNLFVYLPVCLSVRSFLYLSACLAKYPSFRFTFSSNILRNQTFFFFYSLINSFE